MQEICEIFGDCCSQINNWIGKQPEVKEESLSDWFLFNLSERLSTIRYHQFTRVEEGRKTGADWEWWFVFSDTESFKCRVQAKKLKKNTDNYPSLAYTSGGKLQIERLIDNSESEGFASFYAFYSSEESRNTLCNGGKNLGGVFWSEANRLKNTFIDNGRKKVSSRDILEISNPIACLFCCPKSGFDSGRFRNYLEMYFPSYSMTNNSNIRSSDIPLGFDSTPNYILQLISKEGLPDWWEQEYRGRFTNVNSIIAIDLRNEK